MYQGHEGAEFWKTLGFDEPPKDAYQHIGEWSYLYINLEEAAAKGPVRNTVVK